MKQTIENHYQAANRSAVLAANRVVMGTAYAYGHIGDTRFRITRARTRLNGTVLQGRKLSGEWVRVDQITTD